MVFQPGQSGNPGGSRKEKPFREALMLAIKEADADRTRLRRVAESLVKAAIDGEVPAIREIADRLDGKVPQQQIHTGDEDGGPVEYKVTRIEIVAASGDSKA